MDESNGNGNRSIKVILQYLEKDVREVKNDVKEVKSSWSANYVSKEVFDIRVGRLEKMNYGLIAGMFTGVASFIGYVVMRVLGQ